MNSLKVMMIDPSNTERSLRIIEVQNKLSSFQKLVSGKIERAHLWPMSETYSEESGIESFDLYVNEEGLLNEISEVFVLLDDKNNPITGSLVGKGFIVGADFKGDFVSVDPYIMTKIARVQTANEKHPNWINILNSIENSL